MGAGIGYDALQGSIPLYGVRNPFNPAPPSANEWGSYFFHIPNFSSSVLDVFHPASPGEIVAFASREPHQSGHATLWCGGGVLIYAGSHEAKLGTLETNKRGHMPPVVRRYHRGVRSR